MAQPVEIFKNIKGMTRDFAVDALPEGYLWDLVDAIPNRKGARIEQRGAWDYLGSALPAEIQGGYHAAFTKGTKLLIVDNSRVYDIDTTTGGQTNVAAGHATLVQNGVKLTDRVYFFDGAGLTVPKVVTYTGAPALAVANLDATAPKAKVGIPYKSRLVCAGDPAKPHVVYFSRLEEDNGGSGTAYGPLAPWDPLSFYGTNNEVTGLAAMTGQILVFHPASIERIRGSVPPETDSDAFDLGSDTLTDQVGCVLPHTIVPWRENIIWADERGVFLTDGSTVRNLAELGGIGDFWRLAYGNRIPTGGVSCGTFLDFLLVTVNCIVSAVEFSFTMVCDLTTRSWFRFTNFPAVCYIQSETEMEQSWVGHRTTKRMSRVSRMFQDPVPPPVPLPDYVDGNGVPVLSSMTSGFHRLDKEEGMLRLLSLFISYHHQSFTRAYSNSAVKVEYRTDPPTPEDIDQQTGSVTGWTDAGRLPDVDMYSRKKLLVGKRGFGIMVRVTDNASSRITRVYSVGVDRVRQDRGKVTA